MAIEGKPQGGEEMEGSVPVDAGRRGESKQELKKEPAQKSLSKKPEVPTELPVELPTELPIKVPAAEGTKECREEVVEQKRAWARHLVLRISDESDAEALFRIFSPRGLISREEYETLRRERAAISARKPAEIHPLAPGQETIIAHPAPELEAREPETFEEKIEEKIVMKPPLLICAARETIASTAVEILRKRAVLFRRIADSENPRAALVQAVLREHTIDLAEDTDASKIFGAADVREATRTYADKLESLAETIHSSVEVAVDPEELFLDYLDERGVSLPDRELNIILDEIQKRYRRFLLREAMERPPEARMYTGWFAERRREFEKQRRMAEEALGRFRGERRRGIGKGRRQPAYRRPAEGAGKRKPLATQEGIADIEAQEADLFFAELRADPRKLDQLRRQFPPYLVSQIERELRQETTERALEKIIEKMMEARRRKELEEKMRVAQDAWLGKETEEGTRQGGLQEDLRTFLRSFEEKGDFYVSDEIFARLEKFASLLGEIEALRKPRRALAPKERFAPEIEPRVKPVTEFRTEIPPFKVPLKEVVAAKKREQIRMKIAKMKREREKKQ